MTSQALIQQLGTEIWDRMKGEAPGVFNKDYWQGRLLDWAMQDESFKVDLFRFVDVLPMLQSKEQVAEHVQEYLLKPGRKLPMAITAALKAASGGFTAGLAAAAIRKNVTDMAERFIVGDSPQAAFKTLRELHQRGVGFTVDLLGEACVSEAEAKDYLTRYSDAIELLSKEVSGWKLEGKQNILRQNHLGPIPVCNVSLKMSSMYSQIDGLDFEASVGTLYERILPLFLRAKALNVFLNLDLEQWDYHDITYALFERLITHPELTSWPHVGIVVQAYLKSAERDVDALIKLAKSRGTPLTVRLVKGAYWDFETVLAAQRGWACPVFSQKAETDANYEHLTRRLLENIDVLWPAFGSHNLRSLTHAVVAARELKVPENAYELQMLYGMAEPERETMAAMGQRVRVYAPIGALLPGMAYLVRRLLENTSNQGFLRLSHHEGVEKEVLLAPPHVENSDVSARAHAFVGAPLVDFALRDERAKIQASMDRLRQEFPLNVPVVVAGQAKSKSTAVDVKCPSDVQLTVARVAYADVEHAEQAVQSALEAFDDWRDARLNTRVEILKAAAKRLNADRARLTALIAYESAKPIKEADADVAEAIDFCNYYAERAPIELGPRSGAHDPDSDGIESLPGEHNMFFCEGRGVALVIAPWNFPLAILCGMTVAALVAGNTVIMKPAEQSSAIAYELFKALIEVGVPTEVLHFLPGKGELIGEYLVNHREVSTIAFTGSRAVGLHILEAAGKASQRAPQVKRVICEMGGKNAIIVDEDADLDEAVQGVVRSAFGYSGQKCSACSRVIVHQAIYSTFIDRLIAATKSLKCGAAHQVSTHFGPVIDEDAYQRLTKIVLQPPQGAKLLFRHDVMTGGYFVPATILEVESPDHTLMQDELFGPILCAYKAATFDDALKVANGTEYALTGAVYSRMPPNLEKARRAFKVGNLYLNRGSTGALVGRQPFGGFKMSGGGTKAGGPGYLVHFADPRCVTENTMRRGFVPT